MLKTALKLENKSSTDENLTKRVRISVKIIRFIAVESALLGCDLGEINTF